MLPLLLDEGLSPHAAAAMRAVNLDVRAVGDEGAPPKGSLDSANCAWCAEHGAVLVTNDRGKKDRTIFDSLAQHNVHAIFAHNDVRKLPPHRLVRALLNAEERIDDFGTRKSGPIRRRLTPSGRLESRESMHRRSAGSAAVASPCPLGEDDMAELKTTDYLMDLEMNLNRLDGIVTEVAEHIANGRLDAAALVLGVSTGKVERFSDSYAALQRRLTEDGADPQRALAEGGES
ncbi:MAG: DUF5615 family PIN-like protein [Baekduiaceae bacterium]